MEVAKPKGFKPPRMPKAVKPKVYRGPKPFDPFHVVRQAAQLTGDVIVGYSGGKDSQIVLDLCSKHFKTVAAYFFYFVPGMEIDEEMLRLAERRYGIRIVRLPHWHLSMYLRSQSFVNPIKNPNGCPTTGLLDAECQARKQLGIQWIATGQRKADSLERRAMLTRIDCIDLKAKRFYPAGDWSTKAVWTYLKINGIPMSPSYAMLQGSTTTDRQPFSPFYLNLLRKNYPGDYRKVIANFPYAEVSLWQAEFGKKHDKP